MAKNRPSKRRKSGRTVVPDGDKIIAERIARGWRAEDLIAKVEDYISLKTLSAAESGKSVYVSTLKCIADAFGLTIEDLQGSDRM